MLVGSKIELDESEYEWRFLFFVVELKIVYFILFLIDIIWYLLDIILLRIFEVGYFFCWYLLF